MNKLYLVTYYNGFKYLVVKVEAASLPQALSQVPAVMDDIASVVELSYDNGIQTPLKDIVFTAATEGEHYEL